MPPKVQPSLSFAKVAASQGKENVGMKSYAKMAAVTAPKDDASQSKARDAGVNTEPTVSSNDAGLQAEDTEAQLVQAVKSMKFTPSLIVNGSGVPDPEHTQSLPAGSPEDPYTRTDSASDFGTKPPSLDGKSIASGTTFALDEKESLRPDDSASVMAAEEDDSYSARGSIVAGSRIGSEAAARAHRAQVYESNERRMPLPIADSGSAGIMTPQSSSSGPQIPGELGGKQIPGNMDGFNMFYKKTPDEKLIEALESPKDRIFLLRLEQEVITFVKDSKEPFIDFPPSNSFCRMLMHKLADYYHMTHQFDPMAGSVRIFRTPFCRLPQSLTSLSNPPTTGNTPPPTVPVMKIMRRGEDNASSPSKPTSENGSDNKDKSLSAKEKLSREEREAAYQKARERIFADTGKSGDATPEDVNDMSRSSSVSGKTKPRSQMKKKQRSDSEDFDRRSYYTPVYPQQQQQQQQQQQPWVQMAYAPTAVQQFGVGMPSVYPGAVPPQYGIPTPTSFQPPMVQQQFPQYGNSGAPGYMPPARQLQPGYVSPMQSSPQAGGQWGQVPYPPQFQQRGPIAVPQQTIPYPYGQLPSTANPADPKSQHPIPGSFNRHALNPKTHSFVPGNPNGQMPQQMAPHGSPHMPYNAYGASQQFPTQHGYNMSRQSSNASLPSYHASPHTPARPMMQHQQHMMPNQPMGQMHSLPKPPHFGQGVHSLPPKPPPPA